jgi:asparagine synthase (glutamine-hydrolysing)
VVQIVQNVRIVPDVKTKIRHSGGRGRRSREIGNPQFHIRNPEFSMCGIVGFYRPAFEPQAAKERLHAMCDTIVHRGPDDEGVYTDGTVGLGMRRLSIIDVTGGHQPIENEDGTIRVVFNGEIYNFRRLCEDLMAQGHRFRTKTDTEVIVHAYEQWGVDCVSQLNGIFAFALWDANTRRLFLARDRMGVKPLYYVRTQTGLLFSSEIKGLFAWRDLERTLDLEATAVFLRLGFVPSPQTLLRGVRKLPPGWRLSVEGEQVRIEPYWDLKFSEDNRSLSFDGACHELRHLLQEVVADQMVSDVPLGAFLSGGVDSSAVVAFMRRAATNGVRTYSIGFDQQHAYHNETPYAEAVARELGTQHETLIVRPQVADLMPELLEKLDEPLTDTSFLVTYLVSQLAHEHVKVALSGVGGDELFGGYRRYFAPALSRMTSWMPCQWRRTLGNKLSDGLSADRGTFWGNMGRYTKAWGRTIHLPLDQQYLGLVSVLSAEQVATLVKSDGFVKDPANMIVQFYNQPQTEAALNRLLYVDAKTALSESLLLLTDKMGMASSLEVRVPFLDNRLVDFVCELPAQYRMRGFNLKRLLKASLKGVVPDLVLTRSKRGFGTPMGTWLRTDLRPMVGDLLAGDRLGRHGLFNVDFVNSLLDAHYAGVEDYTEPIFALLAFEIWRERFDVKLP